LSKKSAGRPKSAETRVVAVRITEELRERLDRWLDIMEIRHGLKTSRSAAISHALKLFLDAQEE